MPTQTYNNHRQFVPVFHAFLLPVLALTVVGAAVNLYESWGNHDRIYSASLIMVLSICSLLMAFLLRIFALKAQDRAIRAEENFRHFVLAGKPLDPRLGVLQIVALRFAPDDELVPLARRAADESLTPDLIKRSVKNWRADTYRI